MYELRNPFVDAGTGLKTQVVADCIDVRKGISHVTWLHRQQTAFSRPTTCLLD